MYNMQLYCSACSRQNSLLLYAEDDPLFRGTFRTCSNCSTWWIECIIILPSFSYIDGLTPCFGDPCRHKRFCIVVFSFNLSFRYLNETLHQPFRFLFSPCGINILSSVSRYLSSPLPWYFISFNVPSRHDLSHPFIANHACIAIPLLFSTSSLRTNRLYH